MNKEFNWQDFWDGFKNGCLLCLALLFAVCGIEQIAISLGIVSVFGPIGLLIAFKGIFMWLIGGLMIWCLNKLYYEYLRP